MIKSYMSLVTILAFQHQTSIITGGEEVNIDKRIQNLKQKLLEEIQENQGKVEIEAQNVNPNDYYDLLLTEPNSNALITPIVQYQDSRHHKKNHYGKETNLTLIPTQSIGQYSETTKPTNLHTTHKKHYNQYKVTPAHRRFYLDEEERNKPQKWTNCLELITPRLKGYKDDWHPKQINNTDGDVRRLAHLLSLNITDYTKEEIVSTLYQINNIRIRVFQWDYTAITSIFNVLIPGPTHSFKTLKAGVKAVFKKFFLDTTNMQGFLKQTRIFRPPCIDTSEYGGSTKTTGGVRYTKPTPQKNSDDEDCD